MSEKTVKELAFEVLATAGRPVGRGEVHSAVFALRDCSGSAVDAALLDLARRGYAERVSEGYRGNKWAVSVKGAAYHATRGQQ